MYRWYWFRKLQLGETDLEEPGTGRDDASGVDPGDRARSGGTRRHHRSAAERGADLEEAAA